MENRRSESLAVNTFEKEVTKVTRKELDSDWAQKIFSCPITGGKDLNWFRNWSVKRRIPGAPIFVLDFSSPDFFPRPFRLFPAPTNCPWVSEDGSRLTKIANSIEARFVPGGFPHWGTQVEIPSCLFLRAEVC